MNTIPQAGGRSIKVSRNPSRLSEPPVRKATPMHSFAQNQSHGSLHQRVGPYTTFVVVVEEKGRVFAEHQHNLS